jgi:hypothetical protein
MNDVKSSEKKVPLATVLNGKKLNKSTSALLVDAIIDGAHINPNTAEFLTPSDKKSTPNEARVLSVVDSACKRVFDSLPHAMSRIALKFMFGPVYIVYVDYKTSDPFRQEVDMTGVHACTNVDNRALVLNAAHLPPKEQQMDYLIAFGITLCYIEIMHQMANRGFHAFTGKKKLSADDEYLRKLVLFQGYFGAGEDARLVRLIRHRAINPDVRADMANGLLGEFGYDCEPRLGFWEIALPGRNWY